MREFRRFQDLNKRKSTLEEDGAENGDLKQALTDDELPHLVSDESFSLRIRLSLEEFVTWRLGGKGERGESIHDKVDPQHLNGVEW